MGFYLILSAVVVLVVVLIFSWIMAKLLKKDKREFLREESYSLHPQQWSFMGAMDRIYARGI